MKMKLFLSMCVLLGITSCACNTNGFNGSIQLSGEQAMESRSLKGFERVEINGSPTVYYTQDDSFSVRVSGPKELVSDILTEMSGNTLTIRNRGKHGLFNVRFGGDDELCVRISSPDLIGVTLNGSGDFLSEGRVDTDVMTIRLKGSGNIDFADLLCDRADIELVGSGDVDIERLEGRRTDVSLVGSGDVDIRQYQVDTTNLSLRGSGDIVVDFRDGCGFVNAELMGSGDISLKGSVRTMSKHKRGSGDIDTDGLKIVAP